MRPGFAGKELARTSFFFLAHAFSPPLSGSEAAHPRRWAQNPPVLRAPGCQRGVGAEAWAGFLRLWGPGRLCPLTWPETDLGLRGWGICPDWFPGKWDVLAGSQAPLGPSSPLGGV